MQVTPLVSIVVPVYNRLSYLSATLESVLNQTFGDWELMIVDDGSREDVPGFMTQYSDPRISIARQPNQGNAAARNRGITLARGEHVICLDSDDVWHPEMLATCVALLGVRPEVDVAYTQVQSIDSGGLPLSRRIGPEPRNGNLLQALLLGYPILPSSALTRRSCFERWGAYTPGLDDWELWLRWAANDCYFACIEGPFLYYRIHAQNFNLAYEQRRQAHLAMLDKFYSQAGLPEKAYSLRDHAYASQYFHFAVLAWQVDRAADGVADFIEAVLHHPAYLADLDFYTRIACAHQGRINAGTARGLVLDTAETTLMQCLAALFTRSELPENLQAQRPKAYGHAYLALAQMAYGVAHNMNQARRWLLKGAQAWPALLLRSDWGAWMARSVFGYDRLQGTKQLLGLGPNHA